MLTGATKPQIRVSNTSAKVSKYSVPYNPSISTFMSEWLLSDAFVDFLIGVTKSLIMVGKISLKG